MDITDIWLSLYYMHSTFHYDTYWIFLHMTYLFGINLKLIVHIGGQTFKLKVLFIIKPNVISIF